MKKTTVSLFGLLLWAMAACLSATAGSPTHIAHKDSASMQILRPAPAPGPVSNPLKGWCTYTSQPVKQPYSMVYRYVTWKDLEPREGDYQFAAWEKRDWDEPAAHGKHIIFRVVADYPSQPSGMPDWLLAKGVKTTHYTDYGGGNSPDYNDPRMLAAMERLVAALGRRYNKNPRVAFVQMGLLGFWGEWHTYPHNELFATPATQQRILEAAHKAFPDKIVMTRYPGGFAGKQPWLGFFDDLFPQDTDGPEEWKFLPKMRESGRTDNWKKAAIGGEMEPGAAQKWVGDSFARTMEMVEKAHFTWVGPYNPAMARQQTREFVLNSQKLVRRMGYEFTLKEIRFPTTVAQGSKFSFTLLGSNQGVAPFYYPWPVELALFDSHKRLIETIPLRADIRTWLPGPFQLTASPTLHAPAGTYTLALGIRDPWTKKPTIMFANTMPRLNGWTLFAPITVR